MERALFDADLIDKQYLLQNDEVNVACCTKSGMEFDHIKVTILLVN